MTHEEKKKQAKEALSYFADIVGEFTPEERGEFLRECAYDLVQKIFLKNYMGDKAVLAKEICDNMADFIRHSIYGCPKEQ